MHSDAIISKQGKSILPKEVLFVINPNSGKQHSKRIINRLTHYSKDLDFVVTKDMQAVERLFTQLNPKYKAIVIVGGDGTINASLRYLVDYPHLVMAVLPNGSGNGFARDLGFDWNLQALMDAFRAGKTMDLDLLEINEELAINVSGLGIDSYVAYHFQKSKRRGLANYMLATARAIFQFKDFEAEVISGQTKHQGKFRMIAVANTRQFGNNAIIAPNARPYGGRYEVALIKPFPAWMYPGFIIKMFTGKLKPSKYIEYLSLKDDSSIKWSNTKYHLDGEPKDTSGDLYIRLLKGKVKVLKRR